MSKKKKSDHNYSNGDSPWNKSGKLPLDYLEEENSTVSAHECTGLIPRGIKSHDESESYKELYNVYQPDSET